MICEKCSELGKFPALSEGTCLCCGIKIITTVTPCYKVCHQCSNDKNICQECGNECD